MGGLGICGRPFCCSTFLPDFCQVSIKMAKEQNLSLNSSKISGACGRLMCCLRFEHDTYVQEIKKTPPVDSTVKTPEGSGTVVEINPLSGFIKVSVNDVIRVFHRDDVKLLSMPKSSKNTKDDETDIID
jgi:cell fate regulator YaaT (PSP1 superfamily)